MNLGVGGSTHPLLAVRFLCEGALDPATGLFVTLTRRTKYYRATDHLRSPAYRGLGPEDMIEIATMNGLSYSPHTEVGALFYMLGALSEHGRVGMVAIGNSRAGGGRGVRAHGGDPRSRDLGPRGRRSEDILGGMILVHDVYFTLHDASAEAKAEAREGLPRALSRLRGLRRDAPRAAVRRGCFVRTFLAMSPEMMPQAPMARLMMLPTVEASGGSRPRC